MIAALSNGSHTSSYIQFVVVLLIFVFVLALTFATTRWIAMLQSKQVKSGNIKVVETFKIAPNKYIQIIQSGKVYLVIAVCKDTITMLTQLEENQLNDIEVNPKISIESFSDILEKVKDFKRK